MNIKELYHQSIKIIPELDARVLIKHVLDITDADFYRDLDLEISGRNTKKIQKLISRRQNHEPIAYLVGHKEFYGLDFIVNKDVLIPRPESEWLVERAIEKLLSHEVMKLKVLDMGTGSGNIVISIAKSHPDANYFASDSSKKAIDVAKTNTKRHNVKIKFYKSDLFQNIPKQKFDLIIANLPYVPENNETIEKLSHEPSDAIFAADNGTAIIKRFLTEAKGYLGIDGLILIELDPRNAIDIKNYTRNLYPDCRIDLTKDLAGLNRYLTLSNRA